MGIIQPLLPEPKPSSFMYPSSKKVDNLKGLDGDTFVLITRIDWEYLPKEMGFGSGITSEHRLRNWNEAGVWENLHKGVATGFAKIEKIDWSREIVDTFSLRPVFGHSDKTKSHRHEKNGNKHNILSDCQSTPLASKVTTTNRHDETQELALVDSVLPIVGKPGRPRFRSEILKGAPPNNSQFFRLELIKRDIIPKITKRYLPNMSELGSHTGGKRTLS